MSHKPIGSTAHAEQLTNGPRVPGQGKTAVSTVKWTRDLREVSPPRPRNSLGSARKLIDR
jgi:hypothetical protein